MRIVARCTATLTSRHDFFAQELGAVIALEHYLWEKAEADRIPYWIAFQALEWLSAPRVLVAQNGRPYETVPAEMLCLRCGALVIPQRTTKRTPTCNHCAKEDPRARLWPNHAIMPNRRGTWWLRCQAQGCARVFDGRRHALRCPLCKPAAVAASRRRPLRLPSSSA
jgi:hypothetical protein